MSLTLDDLDLFSLEDAVWIACREVGAVGYDFPFASMFACRRPWARPDMISAIGRFGAVDDYDALYWRLFAEGVRLVNSPEEHRRASELPVWYPPIADLTPRSAWYDEPPALDEIEGRFGWPVFLRGSRQTSRHSASLSVVRSRAEYAAAVDGYRRDSILHWQRLVCREYVSLRPVDAPSGDSIRPSFEFRTFWWRGECVGAGRYWAAAPAYAWTPDEERAAMLVAAEAAARLDVPFLVVDIAQTLSGAWIVIEVNDAQESGYAGVTPMGLWRRIIDHELSDRKSSAHGGE